MLAFFHLTALSSAPWHLLVDGVCLVQNDITRVPTEKIILKAEVDRSLWGLLDHLRMHISGAVFLSKSFLMLMHPTGMEAWSFLETSPQSGSGAKLNCHFFRLHSSLPGTIGDGALEQPPRRSGQHSLPFLPYPVHLLNVLNHLYGIEMKSLLPKSSKGSRQTDTFFLIFPSAVSEERNLYIDFLTKSGAKMILSDHEQGTSWDFYRQHYEHGVVLVSSLLPLRIQSPFLRSASWLLLPNRLCLTLM